MRATVKKIVVLIALFILVVFAIFVFNQTVQIVQSARAVHPVFGDGVLWALVFLYALLLVTPAVLWFRLPKRMAPPASSEGAEYEKFMTDVGRRLGRNPRLRGTALTSATEIEAALAALDKHAESVV